jgi:hypothetical protein
VTEERPLELCRVCGPSASSGAPLERKLEGDGDQSTRADVGRAILGKPCIVNDIENSRFDSEKRALRRTRFWIAFG